MTILLVWIWVDLDWVVGIRFRGIQVKEILSFAMGSSGLSKDNLRGLALALSSSIFIGSSFIIKKKGLKKSGATGIRAG